MKILRIILCGFIATFFTSSALAEDFEKSSTAVANMKLGWNIGNSLESNSGNLENMWIERWTDRTPTDYETAWGQPVTKKELIKMMKKAGFNAIRVPVTWYPHMEAKFQFTGNNAVWDPETDPIGTQIDETWMARVQEVVDYVIDEGMYCILNVHHDTGASNTAWLEASSDNYNKNKDTFEAIWTQIANRFKDYDDKLLFEGYNEMLDKYDSWCFASMNSSSNYNANDAADAYSAINSYAQSFVNAVRSTGGNNAQRNLVVCTYGACSGSGTWNTHLKDPLTNMAKPTDTVDDHIIFEIHSYLQTSNLSDCKSTVDQMLKDINTNLASKGPVIFGEWGTPDSDEINYYNDYRQNTLDYAKYFVSAAKNYGFATFYWMGLSDGDDRSVPQFTQPDLVSYITKGYYGDSFDYTASLKGDINNDGEVGVADITLLIDHILGEKSIELSLVDINEDGIASVSDVTMLINIVLGVYEEPEDPEELTDEPTAAPNKPTLSSSDIVLSIFSDTYGFPNSVKYPGGWYKCSVEETTISGTTVTKAVYDESATDTWTGQAGFWQASEKTAEGAKKIYLTAFSSDLSQLTIEIMDSNDELLANLVLPLSKGKWNYLSASVEELDLSSIGNVSVRAGAGTIWFTDLYFAK